MIDIETASTVLEHAKSKGCNRLWLCPHAVSTGRLDISPIFRGLECSASTIPEELKNKKVWSRFKEDNMECIIWYNDTDYSYKEKS